MITFLASLFIKDSKNYKEPSVRQPYGVLSGAVGIGLNILLFLPVRSVVRLQLLQTHSTTFQMPDRRSSR